MTDACHAWTEHESGFAASDGTRLYYRAWEPRQPPADKRPRALVFLHRGHEHSGRIAPLIASLGCTECWGFAWDARGHGLSPGERGDAPDFVTLVDDFDAFVRHIGQRHGIAPEQIVVVANSVGAVIAATWLHDYAPRVRGVVMAAAAFDINLYVPLAAPALALAIKFKPELFVSSYIRPGMLTHSPQEAQAYGADPLITRNISARVLLDLARTARRVVQTAAAVQTPVLMLVADQDYVVRSGPQRRYFEGLSSPLKRWVPLSPCRHALFYEAPAVRDRAIAEARGFIDSCFATPLPPVEALAAFHEQGPSQRALEQAVRPGGPLSRLYYAGQRALLGTLGRLSQGMRIGLEHGFDSGVSLDHVYRNVAQGRWGVGASIDRGYLDAVGWRGIRRRRSQMQQVLSELLDAAPPDATVRILDIAAGGGRYLLETVKRHQDRRLQVVLRDHDESSLQASRERVQALGLEEQVTVERADAFDPGAYTGQAPFDIVIASGVYELFSSNAALLTSLRGIAGLLAPGGHLVYTGQPWHPQQRLIAMTLRNHQGQPWQMRLRPQAELDALVAQAGLRKLRTRVGLEGIFNVSVARRA